MHAAVAAPGYNVIFVPLTPSTVKQSISPFQPTKEGGQLSCEDHYSSSRSLAGDRQTPAPFVEAKAGLLRPVEDEQFPAPGNAVVLRGGAR